MNSLTSGELRVALATTHLPRRALSAAISVDSQCEVAAILSRELAGRFALRDPRIAVCGLNPHAGESGYLGDEELRVIAPAIERMRAAGIRASGPLPADTVFVPQVLSTVRCSARHVSRPGAAGGQVLGLRARRQRDARPAARTHLARSRHRVRPGRDGTGGLPQPHCRGAARRPARHRATAEDGGRGARRERIRRAASCFGQHFLHDPHDPRPHRTVRSIRVPAITWWKSAPGAAHSRSTCWRCAAARSMRSRSTAT